MLGMLKSLISRRSAPTVAERELAYLGQSVSLVDLERRQREIEQGLFRPTSLAY